MISAATVTAVLLAPDRKIIHEELAANESIAEPQENHNINQRGEIAPQNNTTDSHLMDNQTNANEEDVTDEVLALIALAREVDPLEGDPLENATLKGKANIETPLFTGNSNYTGDDTEDNDAGNAGFKDDFPEAKYAYDDHSAEAYGNYTESWADE